MKRIADAKLERVSFACDRCLQEMIFHMAVRTPGSDDNKIKVGKNVGPHLHRCPNGHTADLDKVYPYYTIDGVPFWGG